MLVSLQVNLNIGSRASKYAWDLPDWRLPLPAPGDYVALGAGLGQLPVLRRLFDPAVQSVVLIFEPVEARRLDWERNLKASEVFNLMK